MPDASRVLWSKESSEKVEQIKTYLLEEWSEIEVESFLSKLKNFENRVQHFPKLYPVSEQFPALRKAVISKLHSIVYEISDDSIFVITVLDHRQDLKNK